MVTLAPRGVLYLCWGERANAARLRSEASLRRYHPELPVHVVQMPERSTLQDKSWSMSLTPFEETLYLDADTVVLDRLDYGFAKAAAFGLALCINENPWAARAVDPRLAGDLVEYNTGVAFYTRRVLPLFERWAALSETVDSRVPAYRRVAGRLEPQIILHLSQPSLALAVEEAGIHPFVLPLNWNFRPRWHRAWAGPIKIWHDWGEVPSYVLDWNARQMEERIYLDSRLLLSQRRHAAGTSSPDGGPQ